MAEHRYTFPAAMATRAKRKWFGPRRGLPEVHVVDRAGASCSWKRRRCSPRTCARWRAFPASDRSSDRLARMDRREFLQVLAAAAAAGFPVASRDVLAQGRAAAAMYDVPAFGNVSLLHFTDCHAQLVPDLLPRAQRQPRLRRARWASRRISSGEALLKRFGIKPGTTRRARLHVPRFHAPRRGPTARSAASRTSPRWSSSLKASRPAARCCSTAATRGRARPPRCGRRARTWSTRRKLLGVDMMTGHWEFTLRRGAREGDRRQATSPARSNSSRRTCGPPTSATRCSRRTRCARSTACRSRSSARRIPYTPIANPRYFVADWTFGIQEESLQKVVDEARSKGAQAVVAAVAQRHGRRSQARVARARHRRDPRRPHARRRARADDRRQRAAAARSSPTPAATASSSRCSISTCRTARSPTYRYKLLPVFSNLLPAGRRDGGAHRQGPRAVRGEARRNAGRHRGPALSPRQLQRHRSTS